MISKFFSILKFLRQVTCALLVFEGLIVSIHAQILPPANYAISIYSNAVLQSSAGVPTGVNSLSIVNGTVSGQTDVRGLPAVSFHVTVSDIQTAGVSVNLSYSFEASGPSDLQVPIDLMSRAIWSSGGIGAAEWVGRGTLNVWSPVQNIYSKVITGDDQDSGSISLSDELFIQSNTIYTVSMNGTANARSIANGAWVTADGFLDPLITFDNAFDHPDEYMILVSPGIVNVVTPVPEPSTYGLLGAAVVGALALTARSRKMNRSSK